MFKEGLFMQNGSSSRRFSQGNRFLVKKLVKEDRTKVNEDLGIVVNSGILVD